MKLDSDYSRAGHEFFALASFEEHFLRSTVWSLWDGMVVDVFANSSYNWFCISPRTHHGLAIMNFLKACSGTTTDIVEHATVNE